MWIDIYDAEQTFEFNCKMCFFKIEWIRIFRAKCKGFEIVRDSLHHTIWFFVPFRFVSFFFFVLLVRIIFSLRIFQAAHFLFTFSFLWHFMYIFLVLRNAVNESGQKTLILNFRSHDIFEIRLPDSCMSANFVIRNEHTNNFESFDVLPGNCDWLTWQKQTMPLNDAS